LLGWAMRDLVVLFLHLLTTVIHRDWNYPSITGLV
jgi:hypothetical protein